MTNTLREPSGGGTTARSEVDSGTADAPPRWSVDRDLAPLATVLHVATLIAAFALLLWLNRRHWFITDEWNALVDRRLVGDQTEHGIWDPHNEHWSTIPVLAYRLLFSVFGVRTYLPYVVVMILVHLTVVHLLWRIMKRVGVEAMLATILCGVFAVLGAAGDNLFLAWQWQLTAPIAFGLGALLVTPERGRWQRRDAVVWLLLVLGLMCSGTAITMVVVVGLVVFLRRGWKPAGATVALPALAYGLWYLTYGRDAAGASEPLQTALRHSPAYVWRGLTGALDKTIGIESIAPALVVALVIWLLVRAHPRSEPWPIPVAMAIGAAVFLFLSGIRRSGLGPEQAATSRYVYVTVALLLPIFGMALDTLLARTSMRLLIVAGLGGFLLLVQIPLLRDGAHEWASLGQPFKRRILATAELVRDGEPMLFSVPVPDYIPNLTSEEIAALDRDGDLPGNVDLTARDRLDAETHVQLAVGQRAKVRGASRPAVVRADGAMLAPSDRPTCVTVRPETDAPTVTVRADGPTVFGVTTGQTAPIGVALGESEGGVQAPFREFSFVHGREQRVGLARGGRLVVLLLPGGTPSVLCGIAGA